MSDELDNLRTLDACLRKVIDERSHARGQVLMFIVASGLDPSGVTGDELEDLAEQALERVQAAAREVEALTAELQAERWQAEQALPFPEPARPVGQTLPVAKMLDDPWFDGFIAGARSMRRTLNNE